MTTKEYLNSTNEEEKKQFNRELCEKYPWLIPTNRWTGEIVEDYDYDFTELDNMPDGWRMAFGDQMVEEINQELVKYDYVDKYKIMQIKEKFGGLRWYDGGAPIGKLSEDYEEVTRRVFRPFPEKYDSEKYVMVLDHIDNYESMYDENDELKENAREIWKRNDANAIEHYRKHRIIEKCKVHDIIAKYETLSRTTCICCGKPAKYITLGWISPFCEDCIEDVEDGYKTVEEYFGEK